MFQDIYPHLFNNQYLPRKPKQGDLGVFVKDEKLLCKANNDFLSLPILDSETFSLAEEYLFSIDNTGFFLLSDNISLPESVFFSYRDLFNLSPEWIVFGALSALRLGTWYRENRFCGKCGCKLKHSNTERMLFLSGVRDTYLPSYLTCGNRRGPKW